MRKRPVVSPNFRVAENTFRWTVSRFVSRWHAQVGTVLSNGPNCIWLFEFGIEISAVSAALTSRCSIIISQRAYFAIKIQDGPTPFLFSDQHSTLPNLMSHTGFPLSSPWISCHFQALALWESKLPQWSWACVCKSSIVWKCATVVLYENSHSLHPGLTIVCVALVSLNWSRFWCPRPTGKLDRDACRGKIESTQCLAPKNLVKKVGRCLIESAWNTSCNLWS